MRYLSLGLFAILLCVGCKSDEVTQPDELAPTITAVTPSTLNRGNNQNVSITGTNFTNDAQVDMGNGINIRNVSVRSTAEITLIANVVPNAASGDRGVVVSTAAGHSTPFTIQISGNRTPIAVFSVSPSSGGTDTSFTFDGSASNDPDGSITAYDWDFGDGQSGSGSVVSHQYAATGSFRVVLKVTDNQNGIDRTARDVAVDQQSNQAPEAKFILTPKTGDANTTFRFDATPSKDPDGSIETYSWDFGDGASAKGLVVQHKYVTANVYTAKLTVTDNDGLQATDEKSVDASGGTSSTAPVAQFTVTPSSGTLTTVFSLDASASTDPDGTIVEYTWNMGDGSTRTGVTTQHKYVSPGTYSIQLTVKDNSGETNSITRSVTVQ